MDTATQRKSLPEKTKEANSPGVSKEACRAKSLRVSQEEVLKNKNLPALFCSSGFRRSPFTREGGKPAIGREVLERGLSCLSYLHSRTARVGQERRVPVRER